MPQQCTATPTWVDGLPHTAQHFQGGQVPLDMLVACLHQAANEGGCRVELCDLQGVQMYISIRLLAVSDNRAYQHINMPVSRARLHGLQSPQSDWQKQHTWRKSTLSVKARGMLP